MHDNLIHFYSGCIFIQGVFAEFVMYEKCYLCLVIGDKSILEVI